MIRCLKKNIRFYKSCQQVQTCKTRVLGFIHLFLKDQRTFETVSRCYLRDTAEILQRAEVWFVCSTCLLLLVLGQNLFYTVSRKPACAALHCSFPESPFTYTQHWECLTALINLKYSNVYTKLKRMTKRLLTFDLVPFAEADLALTVSGVRTRRHKRTTRNSAVETFPLTSSTTHTDRPVN